LGTVAVVTCYKKKLLQNGGSEAVTITWKVRMGDYYFTQLGGSEFEE